MVKVNLYKDFYGDLGGTQLANPSNVKMLNSMCGSAITIIQFILLNYYWNTYVSIDCSSRSRSASCELVVEAAELELLFASFVSTSTFVTTAESVFLIDVSFKCGPDVPVPDNVTDGLSVVGWWEAELLVSWDGISLCSGFIGSVPPCTSPSRGEVTFRFERTFLCIFFLVLFPATWSTFAASGNCTGMNK